jgi:hypothetical protein
MFPKKIKKKISLTPQKTLYNRRVELLDKINKDGTYLPKSLLHSDIDGGFLRFVNEQLECVVAGQKIPVVDIIVTSQNWSQFTETWSFQDYDKNVSPPFITVVRNLDVQYSKSPLVYTIPVRKQFYYATVPNYDGDRIQYDVYKIPQPVPVDVKFQVKIICNRMRELNEFNKIVNQKFSSRQAYQEINGHYIPIIVDNISNESVLDLEKRKYYIQTYDMTVLGFLLDENEFEVTPAISRALQLYEVSTDLKRGKGTLNPKNKDKYPTEILYVTGNTSVSEMFYQNVNLNFEGSTNVESFDVYINNTYFGSDLSFVQINYGDTLRVDITKSDTNKESTIDFSTTIL